MNRSGVASTVILFISLAGFSYARQPAQESGPSSQEWPKKQHEVAPSPRQPEANPPRSHDEAKSPKQQPEASQPKTEKQEVPRPPKDQPKTAREQHGASVQEGRARPMGKSARIPDPQFKAHFGRPHTFAVNRVITTTRIIPNQTQFVFSGYTFVFIDPWPSEWLFTDDCYVDYVDGDYFLFDAFHPGIRVALWVVG